nr:MAG TPA: hypothetical protein [Caudoviricetes sp.]
MLSRELALVVYCTMFDDRKSIRSFCLRTRRNRAMSNIVQLCKQQPFAPGGARAR